MVSTRMKIYMHKFMSISFSYHIAKECKSHSFQTLFQVLFNKLHLFLFREYISIIILWLKEFDTLHLMKDGIVRTVHFVATSNNSSSDDES